MNAQDRMMNKKWGIFNHYLYYSEKGYPENDKDEATNILNMAKENLNVIGGIYNCE